MILKNRRRQRRHVALLGVLSSLVARTASVPPIKNMASSEGGPMRKVPSDGAAVAKAGGRRWAWRRRRGASPNCRRSRVECRRRAPRRRSRATRAAVTCARPGRRKIRTRTAQSRQRRGRRVDAARVAAERVHVRRGAVAAVHAGARARTVCEDVRVPTLCLFCAIILRLLKLTSINFNPANESIN